MHKENENHYTSTGIYNRMEVLTESLLESTLEKTRLNITQKAANTMMHRKNEHHYMGMQHM
jgi:hypothetical protein